jgi:Beta-ketoacyl synthase, N-terminal domain
VERLSDQGGSEQVNQTRLRISQWAAYGLAGKRPDDLSTRRRWYGAADGGDVAAEALPAALRRRVTGLGQRAFRAACSLDIPEATRFIFCSRNGEFERTLSILRALAGDDPVSPADFSLSVHNALAGLLSIAWRNKGGHTTIAAGADTFEAGLIEAASCLMNRPCEPVLVVYYDDCLPEPYDEIASVNESCVVLAMLLTSPQDDSVGVILELTREASEGSGEELAGAPYAANSGQSTFRSATDAASALIELLVNDAAEGRTHGSRFSHWRWCRAQAS